MATSRFYIDVPEINSYIDYVNANPDGISDDVKMLVENIAIPTLKRNDIVFDETVYRNCLMYCETNYYPLFPYQKFIYAFFFMYDSFNVPIFRKFIILMGRGNGKDGFISPLANFMQTPLYGIKGYNIEVVANNEDQAKDTFNVIYSMMTERDKPKTKWKSKFAITKEEIKNYATQSSFAYNTSNAKTKDGKKIGMIIFNEYHAYENYDQINVFESALGKTEHPRIVIITTNGYVREGPLDDEIAAAVKILETGENPLKIFPFLCRLKSRDDIDNQDLWEQANPSMPFRPTLADEIKMSYLEMKERPKKRPEFLTKRMNIPDTKDEASAISWDQVLLACYKDVENKISRLEPIPAWQTAIIALDYADINDFASVGILYKHDEEFIWRQHSYICRNSKFLANIKFPILQYDRQGIPGYRDFEVVDGNTIPIDPILDWIEAKMADFNVVKIVMDSYRFRLFKKAFEERGIRIESKNEPDNPVRMIRNYDATIAAIAPSIESYFANGLINYGDSAIMRWYTNNTGAKLNSKGNTIYFKKEPKLRKNDGFAAFAMAMSAEDLLEENVIYV